MAYLLSLFHNEQIDWSSAALEPPKRQAPVKGGVGDRTKL